MAQPQPFISLHSDPACFSNGSAKEPLELRNELVCVDRFRMQHLASRKSEKLRDQLCPAINSTPCSRSEASGFANIIASLDKFEVRGNHREQIVEVVRDAAGELPDALYLLALIELLPRFGQFAVTVLQRI